MKFVEQTEFGEGTGNCFAACIASILELPIEQVPNFCKNHDWVENTQLFLREFGFSYIEVECSRAFPIKLSVYDTHSPVILTGKSPRGNFLHCVIGSCTSDGETVILHDPHPSKDNLETIQFLGFLAKRDKK